MAVCKVRPLAEALTDATVYVLYACILRTFFHVYIICMHYDRITDAKETRQNITCFFLRMAGNHHKRRALMR